MKTFNILIEQGEDGYLIAEVIGLPGCHTQAKSHDKLITRVKEAISLYLKCQTDTEIKLDSFIGLQKVEV